MLFLCIFVIMYVWECAQTEMHIMCLNQTVGTNQRVLHLSHSFSDFLFLPHSLPGPPVVVMGRDLSAHLMQLMFACAWGHKHRDTHSPDTHSVPLSPSVTTLSHSLSSASILLALPLFSPHSLPASSPTLHCTQSLNISQLCVFYYSLRLFRPRLL